MEGANWRQKYSKEVAYRHLESTTQTRGSVRPSLDPRLAMGYSS